MALDQVSTYARTLGVHDTKRGEREEKPGLESWILFFSPDRKEKKNGGSFCVSCVFKTLKTQGSKQYFCLTCQEQWLPAYNGA